MQSGMSRRSVNWVQGLSSCLAPGSIVMPIAPNSRRMPALAKLRLVACELAVGHPMRPGGFDAKPFDLVFLVRAEVALEPEPLGLVVVVALPGQDVRARPVEEPAVVRDHHRPAGEVQQ